MPDPTGPKQDRLPVAPTRRKHLFAVQWSPLHYRGYRRHLRGGPRRARWCTRLQPSNLPISIWNDIPLAGTEACREEELIFPRWVIESWCGLINLPVCCVWKVRIRKTRRGRKLLVGRSRVRDVDLNGTQGSPLFYGCTFPRRYRASHMSGGSCWGSYTSLCPRGGWDPPQGS